MVDISGWKSRLVVDTDIPTPAAGKVHMFFDVADGLPKYKDETGTVNDMGGGGGGGGGGGIPVTGHTGLSVIGRSANSTGSAADIVAANDGEVMRRSGTSIGFGTVATAGLADAAVTYAKIANVAGLSVMGRSANSSGVPADITGIDGQALRVSGTTLGFGTLATAAYADASVTYAKIANGTGLSVLGRSTNSGGVNADIVGTDGQALRVSGTALGFGTLATAAYADASVTYAKIANVAGLSVMGRSANSSGVPADITGSDGQALRVSGTTLGFGTLATAAYADSSVTYAKIQNVSATSRLLGRTTAGAGVVEEVVLDTDITLAGNSDARVSTQKATKAYADLMIPLTYLDTDATLAANSDTKLATQKAVKSYVDVLVQGLNQKPTARVATAAALPAYTYSNGTSGLNATLTGNSTGVLTVDGKAIALNDVVLVKDEADFHNGLYICTVAGAGGVAYVLTRHVDMDTTGEYKGAFIPVDSEGTANANSLWLCTNTAAPTVGTTTITFVQLNKGTDLQQGAGITITGNTISIGASAITNSMLAGSIDLTTKVTGVLPATSMPALTGDVTNSAGAVATTIAAAAVTYAKFQNVAGLSVMGRSTNSSGVAADITGADGNVLRVSGTALGFGTIVAAGIASDAVTTAKILDANVTYAKIANGTGLSVIGRAANTGGVNADITGTDGQALRVSGTTLGFGTLATAAHADASITYAKIQNVAGLSVMGRSTNSSGVAADITGVDGNVLRVSGTALGFGTIVAAGIASDAVTTAKILDANVTNAKLASAAAWTIKGRNASSTGVLSDFAVGDLTENTSPASTDFALFMLSTGEIRKVKTINMRVPEVLIIAVGDETTALTTGTAKVTWRMPYAFTITKVKASLTTVSSSGLPTFDIKEAGTTIFSTKITIDASELTSETAATASVLSDTSLADDAQMTVNIDVAGTGATGAKIYLYGYKT